MIAYMDNLDPDSYVDDGTPGDDAHSVQDALRSESTSPDLESPAVLQNTSAVEHRVKATRSVLALVIDEECVFAGLQGGDIVVSVPI